MMPGTRTLERASPPIREMLTTPHEQQIVVDISFAGRSPQPTREFEELFWEPLIHSPERTLPNTHYSTRPPDAQLIEWSADDV